MGRITLSEKFFPGIIFFALIGSSLILLYNSATSSVARAPELPSWTLFFIIAVMVAAVAGILYKKKLKSLIKPFTKKLLFIIDDFC